MFCQGVRNESTGIVNITGGVINISSKTPSFSYTSCYGVYNKSTGTVNITGGIINTSVNYIGDYYSCSCYGVYNESTGTINIGANDGNVLTESPVIKTYSNGYNNGISRYYGVFCPNGTVNFYDGIIETQYGKEYCYNNIDQIPSNSVILHGTTVIDDETYYTAYLCQGFAWNNSTKTISTINSMISYDDYCNFEDLKSFISKYKSQVETIDFTYDEKIALATNDGTGLFKDCTNLKKIKSIDNLDVSNVQDMSSMFENCTSLTNIDISGWDSDGTRNITNMNSMFKNCSTLTNVTLLSDADSTKDLADTAAMFEGCSKLTNIDLKNITTWAVEDMGSMFKNCSSLTNLDLTMNDTGCVKNMSSMFENCTNLENLKLVEFNHDYYTYISLFSTGNVTNMQNMFKNCSSLKNLELREFYTDKLQENGMEGMLSGLSSLDRIVLGEGIEKLDSNCGLEGDTWFKVNSGEVYTASELTEVYNPSMADVYLNGILEKHYYVSSNQSVDNLYEVHSPDKPFTGYCINLHRVGFGTYLDRLDTNDNSTLESLLDTPEEGGVHGYEPLGNNMKEALITLMYYGYPNDGAEIMEKYNLTESQYADITQEAIWDFTDRYGNPSGPTKYTGDELLAYNELVSQKYSNIENSDSLLFYVYKSWDETQQNMISIMSVANDIYGGVEVTKVDKNGNPLAGAEFTITNEYTGETRTIVSNANGIASICRTDEKEGLPAGIYAVEETKAPKGYNLTSDYYEFEISEANQIVTIGYKNGVPDESFMKFIDDEDESVVGGGLTITKKTSNGNVLANVEFDVYTDSLCTNKISTLKTDVNGVAQSGRKDFEPGKYYVKETKAPYGYKLNETVFEVTITENQFAELEVSNEAKKGKASIVVKKELNGASIADYTFTFELIDDSRNVIQTKTNDKDGVVKFDEIEYTTADGTYKNYTVREVIGDLAGITYDEHEELITVTIRDDGEDNLICTPVYDGDGAVFTNIAEQLSISVSKVWQHYDSKQEHPTSITVNLLADGVKIKSQELSEDNNWKYTFEGLNKYTVEGKEIVYTVTEDEVSGYTSKITGNVSDGFIITNTYIKDESREEDEEIDKEETEEKEEKDETEEKGDIETDELEEERSEEENKNDNHEVEQETETSETKVLGTVKTGDFIVISVVMLVFTVLSLGVIIKLKKDDKK